MHYILDTYTKRRVMFGLVASAIALVCAMSSASAGSFQLLHAFGSPVGGNGLTYRPSGEMVEDDAGNLYGVTQWGHEAEGYGVGNVFMLTPPASGSTKWGYNDLYEFQNVIEGNDICPPKSMTGYSDGCWPMSSLVLDKSGNLFGVTYSGGEFGAGTVFELSRTNGKWKETIIHSFAAGDDGVCPAAGLTFYKGSLYGTTGGSEGGNCRIVSENGGTIFRFTKTNGTWAETILHTFRINTSLGHCYGTGDGDGCAPGGRLIFDGQGNLYGTTFYGGTGGAGVETQHLGTVFELSPTGKETILYSFNGNAGDGPISGLVFDTKGNLYGTTTDGGPLSRGTVFQLIPNGTNSTVNIVYAFSKSSSLLDGEEPASPSGLTIDADGNLYGTALGGEGHVTGKGNGVVFKLSHGPRVNSNQYCEKYGWCLTVLHNLLTDDKNGSWPNDSPILDAHTGMLVGTTQYGGPQVTGTVYSQAPQ